MVSNVSQFPHQLSQHQCDRGARAVTRFVGAWFLYSGTFGAHTANPIWAGHPHLCVPYPGVHCLALLYIWWVLMSCLSLESLYTTTYLKIFITNKFWCGLCTIDTFSGCSWLMVVLYFQASLHAKSAFKASALPSPSTWPSQSLSLCSSQLVASGLTMPVPSKSFLNTYSGNARMVTSSMISSTTM